MKGYKNSTKTVYETEESDYASGYRSGKDFYPKSRTASSLTPSEKGGSVGKIARGIVRATVIKPTDALVKALSHTGVLTDDDGTKASPAYVKGQLKARKDTVGYAEGGSVKKPRPYDPVKDEPTSRPLTADQVRNLRNRMKAAPPKKRAYDPVLDEPTSRPFAKGGKVKGDYDPYGTDATMLVISETQKARKQRFEKHKGEDSADVLEPADYIALSEKVRREGSKLGYKPETVKEAADAIKRTGVTEGDRVYQRLKKAYETRGYAKGGSVKSDMAQDKATVRKAVHKHERAMHPGKPLTKMRKGGEVGC